MSHASLIRPESTLLLLLDFQERLLPAIEGSESVLASVKKLLRLAEILNLKTIVTTQYRKGLGGIVRAITELTRAKPLDKVCFNCMGDDAFRDELAKALPSGGAVVLAGVEAHICVLQSALGLLEAGYNVHVASDATGSRSAKNVALGMERLRQAGAVISSAEMAIYELLGNSRRPEFKQMLPFLK